MAAEGKIEAGGWGEWVNGRGDDQPLADVDVVRVDNLVSGGDGGHAAVELASDGGEGIAWANDVASWVRRRRRSGCGRLRGGWGGIVGDVQLLPSINEVGVGQLVGHDEGVDGGIKAAGNAVEGIAGLDGIAEGGDGRGGQQQQANGGHKGKQAGVFHTAIPSFNVRQMGQIGQSTSLLSDTFIIKGVAVNSSQKRALAVY